MSYIVRIVRKADGEAADYVVESDWSDGDFYWLTDGNMGCDCNRHLMFYRASSGEDPIVDAVCGESLYSVPFVTLPDGAAVQVDDRANGGQRKSRQ